MWLSKFNSQFIRSKIHLRDVIVSAAGKSGEGGGRGGGEIGLIRLPQMFGVARLLLGIHN